MDIYHIKQLEYCKNKPLTRKVTEYVTPERIQSYLYKQGYNIKITAPLKGGVDSQVYAAILDGKRVVVKHTEDRAQSVYNPPFSEIDFFVDRANHNVDSLVLKKLERSDIRVPRIIQHFPRTFTTIMEDLRESGYELMLTNILNNVLSMDTATSLGNELSELALISRKWKNFKCYKNPYSQIFERGLELRLAYPNSQAEYIYLKDKFVNNSRYWMWPDSHPKNIFVNNKTGEVAFIDFGGSYWGDQSFMLPNFIGQFLIYVIGGYVTIEFANAYIKKLIEAYSQKLKIDEALCCKYIGMEVLHRASGKWIEGVKTLEHKVKNFNLGLQIFDRNILSIDQLLLLMKQI